MMRCIFRYIVVLTCLSIFIGCESSKQGLPATNIQEKEEAERHSVSDVWPYIEEGDNAKLSKNLTAKNYILVFDGSGSMDDSECSGGKEKIAVAKEAVIEWLKSVPNNAYIGLIAFHSGGWNGEWTLIDPSLNNKDQISNAIRGLSAGGGTPLTEAFSKAYALLTKRGKSQLGYGEYVIVSITDGYANDDYSFKDQVISILNNSPIQVYGIGFCVEKHSLNMPGRTTYRSAMNPEELRQGLQETLSEAESFDVSGFKE